MFEKISVVFPLSRANSVHIRFEKEPTTQELNELDTLIYRLKDLYRTPEEKAVVDAQVKAYLDEKRAIADV